MKNKLKKFAVLVATICVFCAFAGKIQPPTGYPTNHRWRGFNLTEKCWYWGKEVPYKERDFEWISQFGFNFVRLPLDYRGLVVNGNMRQIDPARFKQIDQAIAWGKKYHLHVCLNIHRAPGYTVAHPKEPTNLWTDRDSQLAFVELWKFIAKRYQDIPNSQLSFNLLNEPGNCTPEQHYQVMSEVCQAIRAISPRRLIVCDGTHWGILPAPEILPLRTVYGARGYQPFPISHFGANWMHGWEKYPTPVWPSEKYNRQTLIDKTFREWKAVERKGATIFVGEFGVYNKTPHDVALRFLEDNLNLWKEWNWGWALWNFRGEFGILDSGRSDVKYEDFHGHKLDRKMLKLLQSY